MCFRTTKHPFLRLYLHLLHHHHHYLHHRYLLLHPLLYHSLPFLLLSRSASACLRSNIACECVQRSKLSILAWSAHIPTVLLAPFHAQVCIAVISAKHAIASAEILYRNTIFENTKVRHTSNLNQLDYSQDVEIQIKPYRHNRTALKRGPYVLDSGC